MHAKKVGLIIWQSASVLVMTSNHALPICQLGKYFSWAWAFFNILSTTSDITIYFLRAYKGTKQKSTEFIDCGSFAHTKCIDLEHKKEHSSVFSVLTSFIHFWKKYSLNSNEFYIRFSLRLTMIWSGCLKIFQECM